MVPDQGPELGELVCPAAAREATKHSVTPERKKRVEIEPYLTAGIKLRLSFHSSIGPYCMPESLGKQNLRARGAPKLRLLLRRGLRREPPCGRRSLFPQVRWARSRNAKTPWNSWLAPAFWT